MEVSASGRLSVLYRRMGRGAMGEWGDSGMGSAGGGRTKPIIGRGGLRKVAWGVLVGGWTVRSVGGGAGAGSRAVAAAWRSLKALRARSRAVRVQLMRYWSF